MFKEFCKLFGTDVLAVISLMVVMFALDTVFVLPAYFIKLYLRRTKYV